MASLKSLVKDTAIYGMSSIIGRFLNYLLVPLYTIKMSVESGGYGIITEIYGYVALLIIMLTFGMETTFFRFVNKENEDPKNVYSTTLIAVGTVGIVFLITVFAFLDPIANWMNYPDHPEYIGIMATCVAIDAFQSIPFAYLRQQKKSIKFASLKMLFILLNISLNLIFYVVLDHSEVIYAFAINLFCTSIVTLGFYKELTGFRWTLDPTLLKRMLRYTWPILILGIAGILNQVADKMIYRHLVPGDAGTSQLAVYGACVKIALIMALITQAFRYAYEPFVFDKQKDKDCRDTYAKATKYLIIFTLLAFIVVTAYLDVIKYIIPASYWDGLRVVPIVMVAEIMMGIYFNLSFWYKLTDQTIWGAWFSGAGCIVLLTVNILFIPQYGYMACAWAGCAGYGTAMLLSYFVGQHYYPIRYPLKSIGAYVLLTAFFFAVMQYATTLIDNFWLRMGFNTLCVLLFMGHILYHDFRFWKGRGKLTRI
ncbi:polysaccharide biosynthesis protein [gut metagenome]|uniref:Polysaccharide biosynthesis protein n=1 Tax=gut metagenome TaxID=749906 RepID=J9C5X0_9ZZZZ